MGIENAFDNGGWSCLHHAVARGHLELVYFMVKKGWEVNRKNQHMQRPPLITYHLSLITYYSSLSTYHLSQVNRKNQHMQRSPLRLAVDAGNLDMIRLLLQVPQKSPAKSKRALLKSPIKEPY